MRKSIKKTFLSILSILGISVLVWIILMANPSLSYANKTQIDFITVYHNQPLDAGAEAVLEDVIRIIRKADIFDENTNIQLCINDDKVYPNLFPWVGGPTAFALFDKAVIKECSLHFDENAAKTKWAVNNYEDRTFNLTWLLAHEMSHNLQFQENLGYIIKSTGGTQINWKLEGHAEYIAREYKNDGKLKSKIKTYLAEEKKEHNGLPVFDLEDGTKQILSYYKYSLIIQYLMDEKQMSYQDICASATSQDSLYEEMLEWSGL